MLKDKDKIFRNLYGYENWNLEGAKSRGIWSNTKVLFDKGSENIIEQIKCFIEYIIVLLLFIFLSFNQFKYFFGGNSYETELILHIHNKFEE